MCCGPLVKKVYPILEKNNFWRNQIDREDMLKILEVAANKGWRSALRDELLPLTDEYAYKYALLESRADWHFLLNLASFRTLLNLYEN